MIALVEEHLHQLVFQLFIMKDMLHLCPRDTGFQWQNLLTCTSSWSKIPSSRVVNRCLDQTIALGTLALIHTQEYLNGLSQLNLTEKAIRRMGLPLSSEVVSRCRYETGGTVVASKLALKYGLASSTAGGTHHAFPSFGAGFCLLNDLAVAAQYCITKMLTERILIVDLDVHQGDGTANIFNNLNSTNVYTFSMHCEKNFPFRKEPSNFDIPLAVGLEGNEYLNELHLHFPNILDFLKPSFVLYDAGVDPHMHDLLGRLCLTDQDLFDRDLFVLTEVCIKRKIPCATVIGGGYSSDLQELARRHTIVHRAADVTWTNLNS